LANVVNTNFIYQSFKFLLHFVHSMIQIPS